MKNSVNISQDNINVLRETFKKAIDFLDSLGMVGELPIEVAAPKPAPKETRSQKVNKYKDLIGSGQRGKKPEYLKK
jgi:hypothetical protein